MRIARAGNELPSLFLYLMPSPAVKQVRPLRKRRVIFAFMGPQGEIATFADLFGSPSRKSCCMRLVWSPPRPGISGPAAGAVIPDNSYVAGVVLSVSLGQMGGKKEIMAF